MYICTNSAKIMQNNESSAISEKKVIKTLANPETIRTFAVEEKLKQLQKRIKTMKTVYDYLHSYGIKPSVQRIAIMEYLLNHKTHPSVDEIYVALSKQIPTLSRTTVYNTLRLFVEHKAANMLTIDERNTCFDAETGTHAHFLCRQCGKIYDLPMEDNSQQSDEVSKDGFIVDEVHRYYKGICPKCQAENLLN